MIWQKLGGNTHAASAKPFISKGGNSANQAISVDFQLLIKV
ncbi:MAG: hypothetical protein ACREBW_08360 [Candidatus Micrarchaeaceae archaeon]